MSFYGKRQPIPLFFFFFFKWKFPFQSFWLEFLCQVHTPSYLLNLLQLHGDRQHSEGKHLGPNLGTLASYKCALSTVLDLKAPVVIEKNVSLLLLAPYTINQNVVIKKCFDVWRIFSVFLSVWFLKREHHNTPGAKNLKTEIVRKSWKTII